MLREVHSLKGAAAAACATRLSRLAGTLELTLKDGGAIAQGDVAALIEAFEAWLAEAGSTAESVTA